MRIAVVAPSEQYMSLAGVRIRYMRIAKRLETAGHVLEFCQLADFKSQAPLKHDAYIFSKCYDARSYLIARHMRDQGRLVGADFFDDYFGQTRDSRFVRHREWIRGMADLCDFYMCSTPRMRDVVAHFMPTTPGHVLNDPFDAFQAEHVSQLAHAKLERARAERRIDIVWFGVGDNPAFPIGLKDLAAYGDEMAQFTRRGFEVNLSILTNRRALTLEGLQSINRLSVSHTVEEWSQEREAELLAQSLVAFIPVNAQFFSIAKSLNRAVTALTGSCQVLSPGYPLYQPLEAFIYDRADLLVDDLLSRRLRMRRATVNMLAKQLAIWGDPDCEAEKLGDFLVRVAAAAPTTRADSPSISGVIHGQRSPVDCHKAAQRLGQLSIGSPFSKQDLNYDVRFGFKTEGTEIQLSRTACAFLMDGIQERLTDAVSPLGKAVKVLRVVDVLPGHPIDHYSFPEGGHYSRTAIYPDSIHLIRDILERLFPSIELFISELDSPMLEAPTEGRRSPPIRLDAGQRSAS